MPIRQMKVEVVNISRNWSFLFNGKKLIQHPNMFDAKTFWNQIVLNDTLKASFPAMMERDNVEHHDFVQVLRPVKTYHFDDACVYFTKDTNTYAFITRLKNLPIIFHETTYYLTKIDERDFRDHVIQLHDA